MLDIILALIELITGEKQKQPPPRRNRQPQGRPQQQAGDPFRQERAPTGNAGQPQEQTLSLEDVIRRMTGLQEEEAEPAAPPPSRRRPPPATSTRQQPGRGQRPQQTRPRPAPAAPAKPATTKEEHAQPALSAAGRSSSHDFAAELRNDPEAARRAFVYSEIFGKPLADRQSQ